MKTPPFIINALNEYFRFIAGGLAALIIIIGYVLLLAPKVSSVQTSQVTAQKNAEADLQNKEDHAAALRRSNAAFAEAFPPERLKTIGDFLPAYPNFPETLLLVKNLVDQSGMSLVALNITPSSAPAASGGAGTTTPGTSVPGTVGTSIRSIDVNISVSGGKSYAAFKNLLANFEASQQLIDVLTVSYIAPLDGGGEKTISDANTWSFTLRTYYLPKT